MRTRERRVGTVVIVTWIAWVSGAPLHASQRPELDPGADLEASVGFRYQSGATVENNLIAIPTDVILALEISAHYERLLANQLWRTEFELESDTYVHEREQDYDTLALRLGRVSESIESWRIFTALAGEFAFVGYDPFYTGGSLWAAAVPKDQRTLRWLHARLGWEEFSAAYAGSDAWVADYELGFGFDALFAKDASAWIGTSFGYNGAESRRLRYGQLEIDGEYTIPLWGPWSVSVDATIWGRRYEGHEENLDADRRDGYLTTGSSFWFEGFVAECLSLEIRYEYERNWSNDGGERYESHNPGIYLHWSLGS